SAPMRSPRPRLTATRWALPPPARMRSPRVSAPTCRTNPIKDFAPVAMIGSQPYVLVLQPALPARNLAELIALAKAKPGTLNYGSAGVASLAHLATALFASMAGVNIVHVPYKSSSQSMTDMITGRLDMQFATIAPSLPNIHAGQLHALATSGKT